MVEIPISSSWIYPLFTTTSLLLALLALIWTRERRPINAKHKQNIPPGPPTVPFVGNLDMLGPLPHLSLHKLSMHCGPIMSLRLGLVPTIVIFSAHFAGQFLKTHDSSFANRSITEARFVVDLNAMVGSLTTSITSKMVLGEEYVDVSGFAEMVHEVMKLVRAFNVADFIPHLAFFDLQGLRRHMKVIHTVFDQLFEKSTNVWKKMVGTKRTLLMLWCH
ncbi:hypothetical protein MRB53_015987 [Persea americana]|uniref:Uncharacterized protein n=1 Tax=Persea americana TaxID=3435 RepID=A0ACC2M0X2_PERAE|nr:hypothetical protein MRB53_015987 [Persea americana]